jgi:flavin-dependent dehydrogenase
MADYISSYTGEEIDGAVKKVVDGDFAKSHSVTLTTSGWTIGSDERYYQTVAVDGVTADTAVVMVDVDLSTDDVDAKGAYLEAWAIPSANEVVQGDGTLTFYAWEIPTVNIPVNVGVM